MLTLSQLETDIQAKSTTVDGVVVLISDLVTELRGADPGALERVLDMLNANSAAIAAVVPVA